MKPSEVKVALKNLCVQAETVAEVAKTANRNKKSLRGDNFYGHKFRAAVTDMMGTLGKIKLTLNQLTDPQAVESIATVIKSCDTLKSFDANKATRMKAVKNIEFAFQATLTHALDSMNLPSVPINEQVLPMAVVNGSRGYLEHMILQANGNYEKGWFDASSVMIRKFIETLIIEVYECHKRADDIKNPKDSNFYMLSGLVDTILGDKAFNLARETKATLPNIKLLGDRSAHNRRYMATRSDVDKIIPGLRVLADDLLHLAALK